MKLNIRKSSIDRRIANQIGLELQDISDVTEAFLRVIREELADLNTVVLDGVGILSVHQFEGKVDHLKPVHSHPVVVTTKKKYRVSFKKSRQLTREMLDRYGGVEVEDDMEKYGVDEQQAENEKRASDGCPECGRKAERHGNVLACPVHGTEPFEAKKEP